MSITDESLVKIEEMKLDHLDRIMEIEKESFLAPWSRNSFVSEIVENHFALYFVISQNGYVIGYAGMWIIYEEAHITTLAVDPEYRNKKIASLLLDRLITIALSKEVDRMALEVRPSNKAARILYRKYGFRPAGIKKDYYTDTGEDAIVLWKNLRR